MGAFPYAGGGGSHPQRVVVRMPNWIGDIVMATPTLVALRAAWPAAHLTAAGPAHLAPLLAGHPSVDAVLELPSRHAGGPTALWRAGRLLAAGRFDLAVLLTSSPSSALVAWRSRVPVRVGHASGGIGLLLTHPVEAWSVRSTPALRLPTPERFGRLLDAMQVPRGGPAYVLATTEEQQVAADAWLARQGVADGERLYGIHPGGSFGPSKLWSTEGFGSVARTLMERHGGRALVFCGPNDTERAAARAIAAVAGDGALAAADDPLDLGALKAVARRLALLVTIDSGPRHIGAAFGVPTVVLMGSTDPRLTNTNLATSLIVRSEISCSPCQRKLCPLSGADRDRCMAEITPAMVLAAAERLLGRVDP